MRDLAANLGISHSTVSRALRDDPRITVAVRKQVARAAQKLRYKRDPKVAELMTHLRTSKHRVHQGTLAWITNLDPADRDMAVIQQQFLAAAEERAGQLGYKLDPFAKVGPADAPRLGRLFTARDIQGVWALMLWDVDYSAWGWDWRRFAFIHTGAEPTSRFVETVDADDRANIQLLYESLAARGYRRIGVATTESLEHAGAFELTAGRQRFARYHPEHLAFEPCLVPALDATGTRRIGQWIKRHRVDCIVSRWRGMGEVLDNLGYRTPEDMGLAYVVAQNRSSPVGSPSGIDINEALIGITAIETLVAAVEQHRFGLPAVPRQTLVPGRWQQGETTRAARVACSPATTAMRPRSPP